MLDYSPSHSELVFRCIDNDALVNIDIFFKGVAYMNVIPKLKNIKIFEKPDEELLKQFAYDTEKHFRIEDSSGGRFSIIAYFFCVSLNRLELLQSSLGDFYWSKENEIFFDSDQGYISSK